MTLITALTACSGAGSPGVEERDAGTSKSDGAPPTDVGVAPDAATPDPRDAQTGGDAQTTSDAAEADNRIDPIVAGRTWTYDVQALGDDLVCPPGMHVGTALGEATVDGKADAIQVQSLCTTEGASYYTVEGDIVHIDYQGTWLLALDAPVQEGHNWSNGTATFTWHSAGSVTVPAGTFDDCWSATENVSYDAYTIFCRGIGPVRWYSKDLNGDGFDAQLTATNF